MTPSRTLTYSLRRASRILCCLILGISAAWLIYQAVQSGVKVNAEEPQPAAERPYDKFRAGGISLLEYDQDHLLFKLSVEEVIHRKRRSRLFEYQNLKELCFNSTVFDIYLYKPFQSRDRCGIPFDLLERCVHLAPGIVTGKPFESYLQETSDIDLDVLSRIQFNGLVLKVHYPTGDFLEITAEKAFIGGDFQSFVLKGGVRILSPGGETVRAPRAVFLRRVEGILLPDGHFRKESYEPKKTFYRLVADGVLLKLTQAPDITYGDPLEEKEEELYDKIFRKLPPCQRIMFGISAPQ